MPEHPWVKAHRDHLM
jgi:hypothetical protein